MKTSVPCCATCASTSIVKAGHNGSGTQQYLCKACGAHRVLAAKSPAIDSERKAMILRGVEVERLSLAANPQMTRTRRNTVEHPFGTIKHAMNQGHSLLKGLRQVRAEFSLSALAYNLLRVVNMVGVQKLVEALRRRLRARARALQRAHALGGWFYARVFARIVRREQNFVAAGLLA